LAPVRADTFFFDASEVIFRSKNCATQNQTIETPETTSNKHPAPNARELDAARQKLGRSAL
jgi:hypothetical protein